MFLRGLLVGFVVKKIYKKRQNGNKSMSKCLIMCQFDEERDFFWSGT